MRYTAITQLNQVFKKTNASLYEECSRFQFDSHTKGYLDFLLSPLTDALFRGRRLVIGFSKVVIGAVLIVFGGMILGGWLDWLVQLLGAFAIIVGLIFFATGIVTGRRSTKRPPWDGM